MSAPPGQPADQSPPAVGPPQTRGKGWLKWGLIGGAVILVLGILGLMLIANQYDDMDIGVGSVPADSDDVTLHTCEVDQPGSARAAGTITNTSKVSGRAFVVHVRFNSPDGTLLDTSQTSVGRLRDGQMVNWEITLTEVATDTDIECEVDEVSYSILN